MGSFAVGLPGPSKKAIFVAKERRKKMAKVFFTREITPEKVEKMYELAGKELTGKVAVKLHSGEKGNQNFLGPDFWRPVIEKVGGTVVE